MSCYEKIDDVLKKWASNNGISWFNRCQDREVRTFLLVSPDSRKNIQVWIDEPINKKFDIHISDNNKIHRKSNKINIRTDLDNIYNDLNEALNIAKALI